MPVTPSIGDGHKALCYGFSAGCNFGLMHPAKPSSTPVLFNYQSPQGDPAVLAILATREGTSATVIDSTRDAFEAGMT